MASTRISVVIAAFATSMALVTPSLADAKPGKGHGRSEPAHSGGVDISVNVRLGDSERRVVRDYYSAQQNCPPGLAKKHNGCLPPGIAKKRYEIGRPVFDDAIVVELPHDVMVRLPPLPRGREYRVVDGDLVVVAVATMVVLDAIGVF